MPVGGGPWADGSATSGSVRPADYGSELVGTLQGSCDPESYVNPPFDPRIYNAYMPDGGKLLRGYIKQADSYWKNVGEHAPYRCNFLYNPSAFTVTYQGSGLLPPSTLTSAQSAARLLSPGMQIITFSLLFDRTYEVNNLHYYGSDQRYEAGVYTDIQSLERCVGIQAGVGGIQSIPLYVFFGQRDVRDDLEQVNQRSNPAVLERRISGLPMGYYGWVTGMDVAYTHFSYNMTPMRATVNLSISQLARPSSTEKENPWADAEGAEPSDTGEEVEP